MITIQICLQDKTVANAITAAAQQGLSFDEYIDQRLSSDESCTVRSEGRSTDSVDTLAEALFHAATRRALNKPMYLVEELYKDLNFDITWEARSPGNRIKLGKAFKRFVEEQSKKPAVHRPDGTKVRIRAHDQKTQQNQQLYFTELESAS